MKFPISAFQNKIVKLFFQDLSEPKFCSNLICFEPKVKTSIELIFFRSYFKIFKLRPEVGFSFFNPFIKTGAGKLSSKVP